MAIGLIGRKIGMTQIFNEEGKAVPVTLIELGPCLVTEIMTQDKNGYNAVQLGFEEIKESRITKPYRGQFSEGIENKKYLKEYRIDKLDDKIKKGSVIKVDIFNEGEKIDIRGISKGRGFQGVVKRYGFHGGRKTHGSHFHRIPGSIGCSSDPSKVFKGRKLPGRMGGKNVAIQNLEIVKVDTEKNLLVIKGAVPGPNGGLLSVVNSVKTK